VEAAMLVDRRSQQSCFPVELKRCHSYSGKMTLTLPDMPSFSEADLRLELACSLYARGLVGKVKGAEIADVDFFTFQGALGERHIVSYTSEMLQEDLQTLVELRKR
jgi:predicted HTH domain antitoxin